MLRACNQAWRDKVKSDHVGRAKRFGVTHGVVLARHRKVQWVPISLKIPFLPIDSSFYHVELQEGN